MSEATFLQRILAHKREEIDRQRLKAPYAKLREQAVLAPPARPFAARLRHTGRLGLIAEIKRQSPSKGVLAPNFDPLVLGRTYADNGADAISVLTDMRFFGGSLQHLKAIRAEQAQAGRDVPLLRKDFVIDPYQVAEARAYGADAVLIIVAALDHEMVRILMEASRQWGMEALVEVHTENELELALASGAEMIGINNRNLHTFEVDVQITERLIRRLPPEKRPLMISLSGLSDVQSLQYLRGVGADAILVGEAIMTATDPAAKVRELSGRPQSQIVSDA